MGLLSLLAGCAMFRPGPTKDDVTAAIESAPEVSGTGLSYGPGGGLGTHISGHIALTADDAELRDAFEEAWRRGVEVLHRMYDGDRGVLVADVVGESSGGATVSSRDLVELGDSKQPTLGHFYDHYGIG